MSIRIDRPGNPGVSGESRTDGVGGEVVSLVSTNAGSETTWLWRFVSFSPSSISLPSITNATTASATFTAPSSPSTLLIELVVDAGLPSEVTFRRLYSIRTANNLRYVTFGERSDPLNTLQLNDSSASTLNEGGAWQGWEPALTQWLSQIEQNALDITSSLTGVTNLGAGEGIFASVVSGNARLKSLVAGTNITLTPAADTITIDAAGGGGGGEVNTASNLGTGAGVFDSKSGVDLRFHGILGINGIGTSIVGEDVTIFPDGLTVADLSDTTVDSAVRGSIFRYDNLGNWNTLEPGTAGQFLQTGGAGADPSWADAITGVTNLGAGESLGSVNASNIELKSLVAGTNITLTSASDTITIDAAGGGGGGTLQDAYNAGDSIATTSNNPVEITALTTTEYAMNIATGRLGMPSSMAIGTLNSVGTNCISIGANSSAAGARGVALGVGATASGDNSVSIGESSVITANGDFAVSLGSDNQISSLGTIAIGYNLQPSGANQLAMGYNPTVSSSTGTTRVGIGKGISATTPDSDVLLHSTDATGFNTPGSNLQIRGGLGSGAGDDGYVEILSALQANASVGSAGQVLTSRGAGLSPEWAAPGGFNDYTSLRYQNDTGYSLFTAGVNQWTVVDAWSNSTGVAGPSNVSGVTLASDVLFLGGNPAIYFVSYDMSFSGALNNQYEVTLRIAGAVRPLFKSYVYFDTFAIQHVSYGFVYDTTQYGTSLIGLNFRNTTSGSGITLHQANISAHRIA